MIQTLINIATLGSVYLLFALGMALVWGTIGILNFAHGATFMFSAFCAHLVVAQVPLGLPAVVAIAVLVGAVMAVLTQFFAFAPIMARAKDHRSAEMRILIAGIGVAAIPLAIAQRQTRSFPFGFQGTTYQDTVFTLGGLARVTSTDLIVLVSALVLGIAVTLWLHRSRQGLALRAIGADAETASLMGAHRTGLAMTTMAVAGGMAGLAGALLTFRLQAIAPESGDALLIKAFAIIVLGGLGSMLGAVVGSYILAAAETLILFYNLGSWVDAVSFGLIFCFLLFRPQGLFGRAEVRRT
ncbi:MAG: branched-chain amino acid ABC transporter permease [Actinomycetales bacterium]